MKKPKWVIKIEKDEKSDFNKQVKNKFNKEAESEADIWGGFVAHMAGYNALPIASDFLDSSGSMIMKTFQNSNLKTLRKNMELSFKLVQTYKPAASKKQSGEIYLYGVK